MSAYPRIGTALARDVLDAIGVAPGDDVETVTRRFRAWLPCGSTAKWAAIDAGHDPPGAEPATALEARLDGSLESWTCWPVSTGLGALLATTGRDVRLAVEHMRSGPHVAPVDYHAVLIVDGQLLDPFLGPSAPIPLGGEVTRRDAWGSWIPGDRPEHVGNRGGSGVYRYLQLADHLDVHDVRAFCAISVTHSGVGRRRTAHWLGDDTLWSVREGDDGESVLRVAEGDGPRATGWREVRRGEFRSLMAALDRDGAAA